MKIEELKEYIHSDWSETAECRNDKYYFVRTDADELEDVFTEIKYQMSEEVPDDLKRFYKEVGFGFLWFGCKQKKGIYRVLSPEELLDMYFEPEDEGEPDDFIMYRENAWNNMDENKLLAFCLFGEEDSLLYIGLSDGAVYYLSARCKIADSLNEFFDLLDKDVDYFMNG